MTFTNTQHSSSTPTLVGAAVAAATATMPVYIVYLLLASGQEMRSFLPSIFGLAFIVTLVALLIIGIPIYRALERSDNNSFVSCGFLGGISGAAACGLLTAFNLVIMTIGATAGVVAGLTFRLVAGRQIDNS